MSIWKSPQTLDDMNRMSANNMVEHVGIRFLEIGEDYIRASMPVDHRTHQPFGILHGGASVVLAETVGSTAANHCLDTSRQYAVGLDINCNHLRSISSGDVFATARAVHIGRSTQVWQIDITDQENRPVAVSRLTMAVLNR